MLAEKSMNTTMLVGACTSAATDTAAGAKNAETISRSSLIISGRAGLGALLLGSHEDTGHDEADGDDPARQIELRDGDHQHDEGHDHHHRPNAREPHHDASSLRVNGPRSPPTRG